MLFHAGSCIHEEPVVTIVQYDELALKQTHLWVGLVHECYLLHDRAISFVHDNVCLLGRQVDQVVLPDHLFRQGSTSNWDAFLWLVLLFLELERTSVGQLVEHEGLIHGDHA